MPLLIITCTHLFYIWKSNSLFPEACVAVLNGALFRWRIVMCRITQHEYSSKFNDPIFAILYTNYSIMTFLYSANDSTSIFWQASSWRSLVVHQRTRAYRHRYSTVAPSSRFAQQPSIIVHVYYVLYHEKHPVAHATARCISREGWFVLLLIQTGTHSVEYEARIYTTCQEVVHKLKILVDFHQCWLGHSWCSAASRRDPGSDLESEVL